MSVGAGQQNAGEGRGRERGALPPLLGASQKQVRTAVGLMRMALALLDGGAPTFAAARLQHAIDTVKEELLAPASDAAVDRTVPAETDRDMPEDGGVRFDAVLMPDAFEEQLRVTKWPDVLRIVAAFAAEGIALTEEAAFDAWRRFSENERCATWYSVSTAAEIRRWLLPLLELRPRG